MRLSLLLTFGFASAGLVACSAPEAPPVTQPAPGAQPGQSGPQQVVPGPGPVEGGVNSAPGQAQGPAGFMPPDLGVDAPPPGEGGLVSFEIGAESLEISLQAKGFGETAELHIIELVSGDFGKAQPRVIHIEQLKGRESLTIQAPAKLDGEFFAMVMEGEPPNVTASSVEDSLSLNGENLSLSVTKGDQATWMSKLPMGPLPENTLEELPLEAPPVPGDDGGPVGPPNAGPPGPAGGNAGPTGEK
ncbi:MAG: hypothetical protein ACI9VR_001568 [Cognaticolwellia sp.]|jgi:hypothetical protein